MNALRFRPWVVWMLCLGLVLPGVGRGAQPSSRPAPSSDVQDVPGTGRESPRSLLADAREGRQADPAAPRGLRILGEVGGGVVSAGVLGVVGGLTGGFFCGLFNPPKGGPFASLSCLLPSLVGFGLGVTGGAALGVWWMGERLGGDGAFLSALGGGLLGVVSGAVVTFLVSNAPASPVRSIALGASLPVLGLTGFVLGYELSQKAPRQGALQPLLSFTPSGMVMGLGGHF